MNTAKEKTTVKVTPEGVELNNVKISNQLLLELEIMAENRIELIKTLSVGTLRLLARSPEGVSEVNVEHVEAVADMIDFVGGLSYAK